MRKFKTFLAVSSLLLSLSLAAFGQVTGGAVTGTVLDSTGAVVPNATVTLRNKATGQELTTQTTGAGAFNFPNVPVGEYTITVQAQGFQQVSQDLRVALNQTTSADVTLQPGQIQGVVEVTAAGEALVQADSSQLAKSFQTKQVTDLPIFGNQNALALLSPNVVGQAAGTAGAGGTVGGVRPRYNVFTVDGVDNNDTSVTGPATSVIQDAVEEFTLLTNNFNAEFGQGGGGQFVTITKSGTNEFHGSLFGYLQSQRLNAASTSQERQLRAGELTEKPKNRLIRYGGTIGGPIVRNKLFFFGAVERVHQDEEASGSTYLAPTPLGLARIAAIPGVSQFVVNLLRNNLVLAQNTTTTQTVLGVPGIPFGEVTLNVPSGYRDNLFQINVDQLRGTTDQFRYRFSFDRFRAVQAGNGDPKFNNLVAFDSRLFSATWVRTFSPSLVNDLRLSYRRVISDFPLQDPAFNDFPNITVAPLNLAIGPNSNLPQGGFENVYQLYDALTYTRGRHTFKFGGEMRRVITSSDFLPRARGDYIYADLDELLLDRRPSVLDLRGVGSGTFTGNQWKYYVFGQDDWKVTPRLTFNLGLRYEYVTLPRDAALQQLNSISSVPGVIEFRVPRTDKNNFAPRVGFAYAPSAQSGLGRLLFGSERGASSIRANFGISYGEVFQNLVLLQLPPQFQQELDFATAAALFGLDPNRPFLQNGGIPPRPIPPTTPSAARAATQALIVDQVQPYTMAFTLSYQRQLAANTALEIRYLGTRSRKLPVQVRLNGGIVNPQNLIIPTFLSQPTPAQLANLPTLGQLRARPDVRVRPLARFGFLSNLTAFEPVGNSQYDSGSISVVRRFDRGLAFTAAYTFSKAIDDSTNELFTSVVNPRRPQDFFNLRDERGLSALDIPHRFVASVNYDLPFFRNSESAFLRNVLGGYSINAIFQAQSGQPVTPLSGIDSNQNFDAAGDRTIFNPNGQPGTGSDVIAVDSSGRRVPLGDPNTVAYVAVNPNAQYIRAGFLARANAGRNTLRSNGFNRTDAVLLKNFFFGEDRQYSLQFGAEVANLFNQRIRTISGVDPLNTAFINVNSPFFNNYSIGDFTGRVIQLRAKIIF